MEDHDLSDKVRFLECGSSTSLINSLRSTSESDKEAFSLEMVDGAICGIVLFVVVLMLMLFVVV